MGQPEHQRLTVGGCCGRVRDVDLRSVLLESLGLWVYSFSSLVSVVCENLPQAIAAMVVEWLEKVELVCKLRDNSDVASVIPLRLTGGAFAVYLQLNSQERSSIDKFKEALLAAFPADPFVAYDQFVSRKLGPDESPDVFLAELRRLATLFGGISEKALACAFVAGLPENVRQLLRAGSRMEDLGLNQILTRARVIITDERPVDAPNACLSARGSDVRGSTAPPGQRCFECGGPNHFARDCLARRQGGDPGRQNPPTRNRRGRRRGAVNSASHRDGGISASLLSPRPLTEALPAVRMNVSGIRRRVLVDTGCSVCVAHASCSRSWRKQNVAITTMCGRAMGCEGTGVVQLKPRGKGPVEVEVIVVRSKPLGYDLILGMNGIAALGGVTVTGGRCVRLGLDGPGVCAAAEDGISIREKDFTATYCSSTRAWKWSDAGEPGVLRNAVEEYPPANVARGAYEDELRKWIKDGWLVPYDESEHGPPKGLLPLMAVIQRNKKKVRPVMDFRELNAYIESHTADADVCSQQKLREWRRQGVDVALIDLKKAYLQIRIDKSLWPYQTVVFDHKSVTRCAILPDPSGIRPECRAIGDESRVELRALPGSGCQERNLGVHRRHPGERKRRRRGPREAAPGALWADVQNPRACR
ncbi:hypothetical protein T4D_12099 [Trichinella pseudospiralis]|uniref:CCHC-type domain-containing protein n=1 Tax=Trichinella pseudospiralis TaxID=6337 RepID=A0A0V1G4K8_TRIPS|nr:hypothetical protein T4D_12099 [Trichinella pseudospiralis]